MTLNFDLALIMTFIYDTLPYQEDNWGQITINPTMHDTAMDPTQTGFTEAYAQSLRGDCGHDL